ncbi:MAG: arylamine N-acetyltransferase [Actinomycetota bacterium]
MTRDVDAYLTRIGWHGPVEHDLDTLGRLQLAHLQSVPFEALDVFAGRRVLADNDWAWNKVVGRGRGGWCFEANGAFAVLLEELGFTVTRLGAAVLLGGPATMIDHLVLEVLLDEAYLVEVGFGDQSPITPLPLGRAGPIETIGGTFEFFDSPQGTTLTQHVDGVPEARYRFKRVGHQLAEFGPASDLLQGDPTMHWSTSPFATRLLDDQGTRITLTRRGLKVTSAEGIERSDVALEDWNAVLAEHFGIDEAFTPEQLEQGESPGE